MKYLRMVVEWWMLFAFVLLLLPSAPFLVLFALPFATQSATNIFPLWLRWLNTWDDPGADQGMYEAQVKSVYDRFGWRAKTWYWLGIRNQAYGLFYSLAAKTQAPLVARQWGSFPGKAPGWWLCAAEVDGGQYFEFDLTFAWSAAKACQLRVGWKLEPLLKVAGPVMFCFELRPFVSR